MSKYSQKLEKVYKLVNWIEDPFTQAGRKRFENLANSFEVLIKHE